MTGISQTHGQDVFHGLAEAGVDYVEMGYRVDKKMFSQILALAVL